MHFNTFILPLLTLTALASLVSALRFPPTGSGKRSAHPMPNVGQHRREGTRMMEARKVLDGTSKNGKRLVRKKRATPRACHGPIGGGSGNNATMVGPTTTALGNGGWTTPSTINKDASSSTKKTSNPSSNSDWKLTDNWSGNKFFDNFNFWSWNDPTHGTVDYLDAGQAWDSGLISINSKGHAIMKVDTTQQVQGGRKSIRIQGNKVYTGGMIIMDALHMPYGCGVWPAWWSNGPNWPNGGEIDILEGVNDFTQNQVSLHTGDGCYMSDSMNQSGTLTTGNFDSHNCASSATSNQGCGVRDMTGSASYGHAFNSVGGGVYATVWDLMGISVWFFPRSSIPSDITNEVPDPSGWGTPMANFPSQWCSPYQFFYDHFNIFDTTFCGDWAGADGVWKYAGYAGQNESCAAKTGYNSCSDYVLNSGSSFADAYWEVAYVKYFNSTTQV